MQATVALHLIDRELIGTNDGIHAESGWYIAGEATEIVVETAVTLGAGASRHIAKRAIRNTLDAVARSSYRRAYKIKGGIIHHATRSS